jgi:hypothetical protein
MSSVKSCGTENFQAIWTLDVILVGVTFTYMSDLMSQTNDDQLFATLTQFIFWYLTVLQSKKKRLII